MSEFAGRDVRGIWNINCSIDPWAAQILAKEAFLEFCVVGCYEVSHLDALAHVGLDGFLFHPAPVPHFIGDAVEADHFVWNAALSLHQGGEGEDLLLFYKVI